MYLIIDQVGLESRPYLSSRVLLQHPIVSFVIKELEPALATYEIIEFKRPWPSKSFLLPTCYYSFNYVLN